MMEFHISREARTKYHVDESLFTYTGNVIFGSVAESRRLAHTMNEVRGTAKDPKKAVHGGALFAMGLIDELSHAMVARFRATADPEVLKAALQWFASQGRSEAASKMLRSFTESFPNTAIFRGEQTVEEWLAGTSGDVPNREAAVEELLMLWLANINPAFKPFGELFADESLRKQTMYTEATAGLPEFFATRPKFQGSETLLDVLKAPMLAAPDSLSGQLAYIRENWAEHLGEEMRRALLAIDTLREEEIAIWLQFHPPAPGRFGAQQQGWGSEGFEGDEFIGFDGKRYRRQGQPALNEYEAFSPDQAWMPNVVLIAKSTYVWLEQLSKKYGRHIYRLDHIPEEELGLLADRGINGLWLIGLWERSIASQTIKRLRGQHDAVASAYSLKDYRIAEDLGGNAAYEVLRDRAGAKGIRLASDMVPNHMGIDSTWVTDHPDWFIGRWDSPFPSYRFEGPDLSSDSRYEIRIEDHYYDQTDAAVAFQLRDRRDGRTQYIYHGNDGTTFAWNDTAQLDYSKAYVREQVIQTILQVARQFPIIRFDAAMVLAKKHVQRLWFPLPGLGGSIPSRAENAMSQEEFDALMPHEFWREVVDRVAVEVPGTLLLAEAFWLLEGYFVRTLGMHRVYNSAFMNMLRDEENAKYRSYLKKTIEFDPDILKRYVNFMSNPDERTAIDQFGTGDKCFGVATLLATLPGLPMFGHGQIEGFVEKYGMEYKQARMVEYANDDLVARHQREIAPLLKNRWIFAESSNFVLYDFWAGNGQVDENVFAYSNRSGDARSIVLYNNTYGSTHGTIHISAASMDKGSGSLRQRSLSDGLGLPSEDSVVIAYRDTATGLEYLRRSTAFDHEGLTLPLRGYQYVVLLHWRELRSTAEQPWDRLCDTLAGAGVHSVDKALSKLTLLPIHDALRHVLEPATISAVQKLAHHEAPTAKPAGKKSKVAAKAAESTSAPEPDATSEGAALHESKAREFFAKLRETRPGTEFHLTPAAAAEQFRADVEGAARIVKVQGTRPSLELAGSALRVLPGAKPGSDELAIWAPILAWALFRPLATDARGRLDMFDTLQLRDTLAEIFEDLGIGGDRAWRAAARVRVLLGLEPGAAGLASEAAWADGDLCWLAGVSEANTTRYVNKELAEELAWWLKLPELANLAATSGSKRKDFAAIEKDVAAFCALMETSGYEVPKIVAAAAPSPAKTQRKAAVEKVTRTPEKAPRRKKE